MLGSYHGKVRQAQKYAILQEDGFVVSWYRFVTRSETLDGCIGRAEFLSVILNLYKHRTHVNAKVFATLELEPNKEYME